MSNINPDPFTTRPEIEGTFGVVTSTHWIATAVGMGILEKGGNAFDAGVATAFTLQVVEPHLNGPGGDVPIIVHDTKRGRTEVICGQGPAPAGATIAHYRSEGLEMVPGTGLLAACVPGTFESWMLLLARLRHDAVARRAGTRDRLRPRRLSAGRARVGDHPGRRAIVPEPLEDVGRGLSAEQRGAEARHALHQQATIGNLRPDPKGGRKRRLRPRRSDRARRGRHGRRVLSPRRSTNSAAPRMSWTSAARRIAACSAPTTWRAGSRRSSRR